MACDLGSFDALSQFSVVAVCTCTLVYKKSLEGQERGLDDFALDASKQAVGALWARLFEGLVFSFGTGDCSDRWLRSVLDVTLALAVELLVLCVVVSVLTSINGSPGDLATGVYWHANGVFAQEKYLKQLSLWLGSILFAKWLVGRLLMHLGGVLEATSGGFLALVAWNAGLELVVVDVLTPCVTWVVKVWVTDDFLRAGGSPLSEAVLGALAAKLPAPPRELPSWVRTGADLDRPFLQTEQARVPPILPGAANSDSMVSVRESTQRKVTVSDMVASTHTIAAAPWKEPSGFAGGACHDHNSALEVLPEKPRQEDVFPELAAALAGMESCLARAVESCPGAPADALILPALELLPEPPCAPLAHSLGHRDPPPGSGVAGMVSEGQGGGGTQLLDEEEDLLYRGSVDVQMPLGSGSPAQIVGRSLPLSPTQSPGLDRSLGLSSVRTAESESPQLLELRRRIADKNQELLALRAVLTQDEGVDASKHVGGSAPDCSLGDFRTALLHNTGPLVEQSLPQGFNSGPSAFVQHAASLEQPDGQASIAAFAKPSAMGGLGAACEVVDTWGTETPWECSGAVLDDRISSLEAKLGHLVTAVHGESGSSNDVIDQFLGEGVPSPCRSLF